MSFFTKLIETFELAGRAKTLAHLNTMGQSQLDDLGFSRELMAQGVSAYPWRTNDIGSLPTLTETRATSKEIRASIEELQALNDRDLEDIGIARYEIEDVVINGRNDGTPRAA